MSMLCLSFLFKLTTPVYITRNAAKQSRIKYAGPKTQVKVNLIKNENGYHLSFFDPEGGNFLSTSPIKTVRKSKTENSYVLWTANGDMYFIQ